jgi:hypothetical protein
MGLHTLLDDVAMGLALKPQASGGEAQLVADHGVQRFTADWNNPSHRVKRLLAEFLGVAGGELLIEGTLALRLG